MQNIFLLFHQKCSKTNDAHLGPGGLLYYSLCLKNNTFRVWPSLFCKHTPSKIFARCFCQNFSKVFLPACPFIPTSPFNNLGDFGQPPRLLFWPKFACLSVYSALSFYLKLESNEKPNFLCSVSFSLEKTFIITKRPKTSRNGPVLVRTKLAQNYYKGKQLFHYVVEIVGQDLSQCGATLLQFGTEIRKRDATPITN